MTNAPKADWLRRFASHAIELNPLTLPLEAMRGALFAHREMGDADPRAAAERWWADTQHGDDAAEPGTAPRHTH